MNNQAFSKIWIIVVALVVLAGGIFAWQYFGAPEEEVKVPPSPVEKVEVGKEGIVESEFICGVDTVKDVHGNIYGTVKSQGRCWMDRNLGASRVATAYNDATAYGYLFQWGRSADGHQIRNSGLTTNLSGFDNPGHSNFIYGMGSPYDWRSPQNDNLWQGADGINNPCPDGWRVPTKAEWEVERVSWSSSDRAGAYASSLKLTVAGLRAALDGTVGMVGTSGYYWSSTAEGTEAIGLWITIGGAKTPSYSRNLGLSVRCIKD